MTTYNESYLLRKERCPRCASNGKDTSADNLSVWSDGHVYCFACGYRRKRGKPQLANISNAGSSSSVSHKEKKSRQNGMYKSLPTKAKQYLVSQGLTEKEIAKYHFYYDSSDGSIICPIYNDKNEEVMKLKRYNWKDFDPKMPKYKCLGKKPYIPLESHSGFCIVVEDMISAIKLTRLKLSIVPLFGTKLPKHAALTLAKKYDRMYVWLDRDKAVDAVRMSRRWNYFFKEGSKVIVTDYDPKQYTDDEIEEILDNHCYM